MAALHPFVYLMVTCFALASTAVVNYDQGTASLQQVPGVLALDPETSFLFPRLADKYRPETADWIDESDPRLYMLAENEGEELLVRLSGRF